MANVKDTVEYIVLKDSFGNNILQRGTKPFKNTLAIHGPSEQIVSLPQIKVIWNEYTGDIWSVEAYHD